MAYDVLWSELALKRIEEIFDYIAQDNPAAAAKVTEQIFDRVAVLALQPRMGKPYSGTSEENLRELLVSSYRVLYELNEAQRQIWILTVRHQRQRPLSLEDQPG